MRGRSRCPRAAEISREPSHPSARDRATRRDGRERWRRVGATRARRSRSRCAHPGRAHCWHAVRARARKPDLSAAAAPGRGRTAQGNGKPPLRRAGTGDSLRHAAGVERSRQADSKWRVANRRNCNFVHRKTRLVSCEIFWRSGVFTLFLFQLLSNSFKRHSLIFYRVYMLLWI